MSLMSDALRLTKDGLLREATALLRRGLGASDGFSSRREDRASSPAMPRIAGAQAPRTTAPKGDAEPGFAWHEVANISGARRYKLYVPSSSTAERPLLIMLHGCTQSPDDFAAGTRMNAVAAEHDVLVAYPEQTSAHNGARCWNWFKPGDQRRGGGEVALLAAIVDDVSRDHAIDRRRVFVAGLSAGGAAAAGLAQAYPEIFAAVGVHSGLACGAARDLPTALTAMRKGARGTAAVPIPTIVFHGDADRTVAPANATHVLAGAIGGLASQGIMQGVAPGGATYTREVWHDASGRTRAESWRIEGAGHAWAGGSPAGSFTDPRGPDASRAMMRFFLGLRP